VLEEVPFDRLVLNGDIFDDLNFRRLNRHHWDVLERFKVLSKTRELVWIRGNHDGTAGVLHHLLDIPILDEYTFDYGGRLVYVVHGDQFDDFQRSTKRLRSLKDLFYGFAIWFDIPRKTAIQWVQRSSFVFARAADKVRRLSVERGIQLGAAFVVAGHTHRREVCSRAGVTFLNPSSWLTPNPAYVLFDEAEEAPRLVVLGRRKRPPVGRAVKSRVRRVLRKKRIRAKG
jgi:UDP-2,3-diacylglucosamine pyrophosphatase LpxH